jgi:hypothetical protein
MSGWARLGATKIPKFTHLSILTLLTTAMLFYRPSDSYAQTTERTKVAEGEYLIHTDSPYDKQQVLREPWVLWWIGDGRSG